MTVVINMHKLHIQDICHAMIMKVSCQSYAHPIKVKCYQIMTVFTCFCELFLLS